MERFSGQKTTKQITQRSASSYDFLPSISKTLELTLSWIQSCYGRAERLKTSLQSAGAYSRDSLGFQGKLAGYSFSPSYIQEKHYCHDFPIRTL